MTGRYAGHNDWPFRIEKRTAANGPPADVFAPMAVVRGAAIKSPKSIQSGYSHLRTLADPGLHQCGQRALTLSGRPAGQNFQRRPAERVWSVVLPVGRIAS